jgi:hypothetical protein
MCKLDQFQVRGGVDMCLVLCEGAATGRSSRRGDGAVPAMARGVAAFLTQLGFRENHSDTNRVSQRNQFDPLDRSGWTRGMDSQRSRA